MTFFLKKTTFLFACLRASTHAGPTVQYQQWSTPPVHGGIIVLRPSLAAYSSKGRFKAQTPTSRVFRAYGCRREKLASTREIFFSFETDGVRFLSLSINPISNLDEHALQGNQKEGLRSYEDRTNYLIKLSRKSGTISN